MFYSQEEPVKKTQGHLIQRFLKLEILRELPFPSTFKPSISNHLTITMGLILMFLSGQHTLIFKYGRLDTGK